MSADSVYSYANVFLIFSLVVGVLATFAIAASGKIRDEALNREIAASNERAAEANARALEASLALEKFKAPRSLSMEAQQRIVAKVKPFAGTQFNVSATQDKEALNLLMGIEDALNAAEWKELKMIGEGTLRRNGRPSVILVVEVGVSIQVAQSMKEKLLPTAKALVEALNEEGIDARDEFTWNNSNSDIIHVVVGQKPQ